MEIFVLEDDAGIRELVCYSLNKSGMTAQGFERPSEMRRVIAENRPDLLILDVMLPEEDGLSVLSWLRSTPLFEKIPVVMLTAKGTEFDKVTALDAGADDYITKPFSVMELVARVRAVLRRFSTASLAATDGETVYRCGDVTVSVPAHTVQVGQEMVTLTYKEFELLCFLFAHRGNVLSRDQILREVWGYEFDGENRTVDVHIRTLRQKLGDAGGIVETVRGVGYKIGRE